MHGYALEKLQDYLKPGMKGKFIMLADGASKLNMFFLSVKLWILDQVQDTSQLAWPVW